MDAVAVTSCFSSPTSPRTESSVPLRIAVLVDQALAQSQLAGDRSVKRRIRQRLQRKLSSFLSEKDFENAMSHFRTMLEACAFDPSERLGSGYGYDQPERKALVTDGKDVSEDVGLHFTYDVCYLHFDEKSLPGTPCVCLAADRQTFLNHKSVLERL